jgi:hypothetical protein
MIPITYPMGRISNMTNRWRPITPKSSMFIRGGSGSQRSVDQLNLMQTLIH